MPLYFVEKVGDFRIGFIICNSQDGPKFPFLAKYSPEWPSQVMIEKLEVLLGNQAPVWRAVGFGSAITGFSVKQ